MAIFIQIWLCLFSLSLFAEKASYPTQKISAKGVKSIQIAGVNGSLKLVAKPIQQYRLSVKHTKGKKFEDWSLSVDRRQDVLHLEVFSVAFGAEWRKHVRQELWPEFDVILEGPEKPTVVSWRQGRVESSGWGDLEVSLLKGELSLNGGNGPFKLQTVEVLLKAQKITGALVVQGERGTLALSDILGTGQVTWPEGSIQIKNFKGDLKMDAQRANLNVQKASGRWDVTLPEGKAAIQNFSGHLKGQGQGTGWTVHGQAPVEIEITNGSGNVQISRSPIGPLKVFLTSASGKIDGPQWLKTSMRENVVVREGQQFGSADLAGTGRSDFFVRTQSGSIVLAK